MDEGVVPIDPGFEARVRTMLGRHRFLTLLGAEVTAVAPGYCRIEAPFDDRFTQHNGFLHAGMQTTLVDSAGGGAAATLVAPDVDVLAVEFKVNFVRPAVGERIVAEARVVRPGRRIVVCDLDVHMVAGGVRRRTVKGLQTVILVHPGASGGAGPRDQTPATDPPA